MVKSNKFDYTGRTSSGPKLGRSIAADLEKRADKKQREVLKSSTKLAFKSHFPTGRLSKKERERSHDQDTDKENQDASKSDTQKLDLKVPGKSLGDEGFALLCEGLHRSLASCQDLALVDLNASDNLLTTRSLARLAPIIFQSRFNLQTLDLSNNNFQVTTSQEARDWECFLHAFHDCMTLRRVDLSDNPSFGPWAFEILARIYTREPAIDPLPATGTESMITLPDEDVTNDDAESENGLDGVTWYGGPCTYTKVLTDTLELGYRRGLKSLPYLTLSNVGLTDTGALFLSYIIEQHYYPTQLITEVNATEATNVVRTYRQDANLKGVDWDNNVETLGKDGLHLLQCAERQRASNILGDNDSFSSSAYEIVRHTDAQDQGVARKPYSLNGRRTSIRSMHSVEYSVYDKSDINSARKKIQRNTIIQSGCRSVELWHAALKAVAFSRLVYLFAPEPRNPPETMTHSAGHPPQAASGGKDGTEADLTYSVGSLASYEEVRSPLNCASMKHSLPPVEESSCTARRSYAATLMTTTTRDFNEPEVTIADVYKMPISPTFQSGIKTLYPHRRDNVASEENHAERESPNGSQHVGASQHFKRSKLRSRGKKTFAAYQISHMQELQDSHGGQSDGYRDASLRCQLPLPVCVEILGHLMEPHQFSVLNAEQQQAAFAWGQKRETLRSELDWRRKDESSQILMLLTGAQCVDC